VSYKFSVKGRSREECERGEGSSWRVWRAGGRMEDGGWRAGRRLEGGRMEAGGMEDGGWRDGGWRV
jgi:hypothetical protein